MAEEKRSRGRPVAVAGTGTYIPERVITNADLEKMVDTNDEWIRTRTGITTRHIVDEKIATSDISAEAGRRALEDAGLSPADVDLVIVGTITPDTFFPSTACWVQDALGCKRAAAFDLSAACSGFIYGLAVARQMIASGTYDNALVIGAETLSKITDWTDRNTCILFGDGAGAAVLTASDDPERGLLSENLGSDGSLGHLLIMPGGGSRQPPTHESLDQRQHYVKMSGNTVFKFAVRAMGTSALKALAEAGKSGAELDLLITHQANLRIIEATARLLKVPMEKVYLTVHRYGNTSSASIPVALHEAKEEGRIKPGSLVELVAFGGGFTWGSAVIRW